MVGGALALLLLNVPDCVGVFFFSKANKKETETPGSRG
jgi:hypothetical protein